MDGLKRTVGLGTIEMRADGILHTIVDFTDDASESGAAEYLQARDELVADNNPPVLIEILASTFVERSIREFMMANQLPPPCRAVVANDPSLANVWKSFQMLDTSGVPTKLFSSVDRAVDWIHQQVEPAPGF